MKKKVVEDSTPVLKNNGMCVTFSTMYPEIWYKVLGKRYHEQIDEHDENTQSDWKEPPGTETTVIKYKNLNDNFSVSLFIFIFVFFC